MSRPNLRLEDAANILTKYWATCSDAFGLAVALREMGLLKVREPLSDRETEIVCDALEEAADRLVNFSTNPLYHKALLRGAKLIREMKHEREMRALSALRQNYRGACLSKLKGDLKRAQAEIAKKL